MIPTYSPEAIEYFVEIALGAQFGEKPSRIRKWYKDLRIQILGITTLEDIKMLQETVEELNPLLTGINIFLSYIEPNVSLYFAPPLDFKKIAPEFVAANNLDGFYWVWWNENTIYEAKIIINCLTITQGRRSQLIRQLITRSLGFLSDSERYDKSIFHRKIRSYQDASLAVNVAHRITKFADIDYTLIKMLYSPNILHGQTENEVRKWLSQ